MHPFRSRSFAKLQNRKTKSFILRADSIKKRQMYKLLIFFSKHRDINANTRPAAFVGLDGHTVDGQAGSAGNSKVRRKPGVVLCHIASEPNVAVGALATTSALQIVGRRKKGRAPHF